MADFIKKNWQKDASQTLLNAGARITGGMLGGFVLTKLGSGTGNGSQTLKNIGGPAATILGVLGDMMIDQPQVRAMCQGLYTYAAMHSVAVIAPDSIGPKIGVNGLGDMEDDAALMSAVDENYQGDISNEIKNLTTGANANDGNDWAQVAEQIDVDGAVQGTEDEAEENAELMGDDAEEDAELMGDDEIEVENAELMGIYGVDGDDDLTEDEENALIMGMF